MENPAGSRKLPVVVVHGALRSRVGLWPTATYLQSRGLAARVFGYRTRRDSLVEHAERLAAALETWGFIERGKEAGALGFVTHSMGALVVRAYLGGLSPDPDFRVGLVMLSPPNRGATLAHVHRNNWAFRALYGQAARELQRAAVTSNLGDRLPPFVRGLVLAGGRGDSRGYHPRISGDDDGVVALQDMPVGGADFQFVGGRHSLLQWRSDVLDKAAAFLEVELQPDIPTAAP